MTVVTMCWGGMADDDEGVRLAAVCTVLWSGLVSREARREVWTW